MSKDNSHYHPVELLARLGHEYRHFQQEHDREPEGNAAHRVLETKMDRISGRFARLLSHWVQDEALRDAWTKYLFKGGVPPEEPKIARSCIFKGINESGAHVEIRASKDGGYDRIIDGSVESHEEVPWHLDPDLIEPIQIGEHSCQEIFDAPPEAVRALAEFQVSQGSEPP